MEWIDDPSPAMQQMVAALARQAIAQDPGGAGPWRTLAETTRKAGEPLAALAILEPALAAVGDDPQLLLCQARARHMLGDYPAALAAVEQVLALSPGSPAAQFLRCDTLLRLQSGIASATLDGLAAADPDRYFELQAKLLKTCQAHEALIALCDSHLARHPGHTSATFFKTLALLYLGRVDEARALLDYDRRVQVSALDNAVGPQARAAIIAEILRNPTLAADPSGKSVREGLQTRQLRQPDAPAVDALLGRIKAEVDAYVARLEGDDSAFARARPARARLSAWAVVYGAAGRQQVHHHASGWLSGVFYLSAPRVGETYNGALLLGPLTLENRNPVRHPGSHEIEPVPGRLLLFPSYMPHATLPPQDEESRIVVSFDVVPVAAGADQD